MEEIIDTNAKPIYVVIEKSSMGPIGLIGQQLPRALEAECGGRQLGLGCNSRDECVD